VNDVICLPVFGRLLATAARSLTIAGLAALLNVGSLGVGPIAHAQVAVLT
jgi:hypothetical protein